MVPRTKNENFGNITTHTKNLISIIENNLFSDSMCRSLPQGLSHTL